MPIDTGPLTMDQLDLLRRERLALSKLTDQQKAFCEEWVRSFNKLSALKAGKFWTPKYQGGAQDKLLNANFEALMNNKAVQEYIFLLKQSVASRLGVSMDAIIDEYRAMAFANIADYVEWTDKGFTSFKGSNQLTRAQKAGIVEVIETTTKSGTTIKIKLCNKQSALDRLFDVLKDLEEHETKQEGPVKISQTQINVMLADPVKRRAIEHLAEGMFDKKIFLKGTDAEKLEFDKQLTRITGKLLERAGGITSAGDVGVPRIEAPEVRGRKGKDTRDCGQVDEPLATQSQGIRKSEGETEGDAIDQGDEQEEGCRYDINGL